MRRSTDKSATSPTLTTDVLVVGAGPAGLTMAALLARSGARALTVTRHRGTAHTPRAHITNQRTMEVLRDLGVESAACAAGHPFQDVLPNIVWATTFAGTEIARVRVRGAGPERISDYALASPCQTWNIPQHRLEPVLLAAACDAGADIRFGSELTALSDHGDHVEATILDRTRSPPAVGTIRARWLVGADGGSSAVARLAGFEMDGRLNLRRAVNIWAEVDLAEFCAHRPANIYGIHQPGRDAWMGAGLWVCTSPWDEWVVSRFIDADEVPAIDEPQALSWLRDCIGADVPIRIRDIGTWAIHDAVATEYRRGNVLLVGDAAHRHPPVNGLGTNTSIQDSYNLGWKLSLVAAGLAHERLLDSYEAERRPVGKQVVKRSWASARDSVRLGEAIGLRPGQSQADGLANLAELRAAGEQGRRRRAALRQALEQTRFQFNAQGVELGQRYLSSAVIPMEHPAPRPHSRDPELYYDAAAEPGACLPHVWVEHGKRLISTLDIPRPAALTLIIGIGGDSWQRAAREIEGVKLHVAAIGYRLAYDDVYGDWQNVRGIADDGCLLVRPDRFIAWRAATCEGNATATLAAVLSQILGAAPAEAGTAP